MCANSGVSLAYGDGFWEVEVSHLVGLLHVTRLYAGEAYTRVGGMDSSCGTLRMKQLSLAHDAYSYRIAPTFTTTTTTINSQIYYPFNYVLPSGYMFTFCGRSGYILDYTTNKWRQVRTGVMGGVCVEVFCAWASRGNRAGAPWFAGPWLYVGHRTR